jgi:hypothetical protein
VKDVGHNFERVAETKQQYFARRGYEVIVIDAHSARDFIEAFNSNGMFDGVEYVGHASLDWLGVGNAHNTEANFNIPDVSQL